MLSNRSLPTATVIPVLAYPDVRAAVDWLTTAFGFVEHIRIGQGHRSQMRVGDDAAAILAAAGNDHQPSGSASATHVIKVRVPDVDARFERAEEWGGHTAQP